MTGRAAKRSSQLDPDGDVAPVGRAIDDQQINREQVAEVDELVDLGRGGQLGVLRIARGDPGFGGGGQVRLRFQMDSDRMILWSG